MLLLTVIPEFYTLFSKTKTVSRAVGLDTAKSLMKGKGVTEMLSGSGFELE